MFHSRLNKNGLTPLWIAAWYNNIRIGVMLLRSGANPNDTDPEQWLTPLHCAIYGYHLDRADDTAEFVGELIEKGADTMKLDRSGETPAHLVVGTLDFRLMTKFIDELGAECLNLKDDSGNTLFHFAVGCVDEHLIYRMIDRGADLLSKNYAEVEIAEDADGTEILPEDSAASKGSLASSGLDRRRRSSLLAVWKSKSVVIQRLPVQEAMKNGNSRNYFNALRRVDFATLAQDWTPLENEEFLTSHLIAATREVRPDIVRIIFQNIDDVTLLHKVLLFCDKNHEDETFTKTALEWAVENNDRLCTTEILHQGSDSIGEKIWLYFWLEKKHEFKPDLKP